MSEQTDNVRLAGTPLAEDVVVSVRDVGKMYRIYDRPEDRLKQMLLWRFGRSYGHEFWALRGVSFEVRRGETLGIIGRNGSGKSTLLQIIAGTLAPTEGEAQVRGRVTALLELGSGFNPEFTGRENVFMNGAILGLSQAEMEARFDEIAAFADIGEFIDQPVKFYSSGMMLRLAFAVQACVEPDVLIVDEALAVGDVFFQQKCYRRLNVLRERGTAVMLVSHALGDIRQYCERAVLLNHGRVAFFGSPVDTIAHYMLQLQSEMAAVPIQRTDRTPAEVGVDDLDWPRHAAAFLDIAAAPQVSNGWARCTSVALCDASGNPATVFEQGETLRLFYEFELRHDIDVPIGGFNIESEKTIFIHGKNTLQYEMERLPAHVAAGARVRFRHDVVLDIAAGHYTLEVGLACVPHDDYERRHDYDYDGLYSRVTRICHLSPLGPFVVVPATRPIPGHLRHFGVTNLPGAHRLSYVIQSMDAPDPAGAPAAAQPTL